MLELREPAAAVPLEILETIAAAESPTRLVLWGAGPLACLRLAAEPIFFPYLPAAVPENAGRRVSSRPVEFEGPLTAAAWSVERRGVELVRGAYRFQVADADLLAVTVTLVRGR